MGLTIWLYQKWISEQKLYCESPILLTMRRKMDFLEVLESSRPRLKRSGARIFYLEIFFEI